jgi:tripartite-type tricarboxylate transporter receptor subunit TctC
VTDLMGGQIELAFTNPANVISHIKSGKLKAIAIGGATRLRALPQVPTFAEVGLPAYDAKRWQGILAPAGTPKAIVDKLSTEIGGILAMPDIKEKIISQGVDPFISTPEQFTALMKADMAKYEKIVRLANIKME